MDRKEQRKKVIRRTESNEWEQILLVVRAVALHCAATVSADPNDRLQNPAQDVANRADFFVDYILGIKDGE